MKVEELQSFLGESTADYEYDEFPAYLIGPENVKSEYGNGYLLAFPFDRKSGMIRKYIIHPPSKRYVSVFSRCLDSTLSHSMLTYRPTKNPPNNEIQKESVNYPKCDKVELGCSDSSTGSKRNYPVSWSSGYRMADFLSTEVTIEKQQDLRYLLEVPWYTEIVVTGTKNSDQATFSNCKTYLSEATEKTRTLRENEINAFLELAMMCRATDTLLKATAAYRSNIPTDFFNESTPKKFPVVLALVISESEFAKYAQDKSIKYWGDVNKKHRIEFISNDQVEFHHDGGIQRLALVGRGDFNGDEIEDILISSRDSVVGGSYFNIRLFALSVDTEGEWQLIEEFTF